MKHLVTLLLLGVLLLNKAASELQSPRQYCAALLSSEQTTQTCRCKSGPRGHKGDKGDSNPEAKELVTKIASLEKKVATLERITKKPVPLNFYILSQGADDGWRCDIRVDGTPKAKQSRGFCVVAYDVYSKLITSRTFDTLGVKTAETEMKKFLKGLKAGTIIAIAIGDAVGIPIDNDLRDMMEDLGAVGSACNTSDIAYRDSFAFIGQKLPEAARRPLWVKCQHVPRYGGKAIVEVNIIF